MPWGVQGRMLMADVFEDLVSERGSGIAQDCTDVLSRGQVWGFVLAEGNGAESNATLEVTVNAEMSGYVSEPRRGRRQLPGQAGERGGICASRRRAADKCVRAVMHGGGELLVHACTDCRETGTERRVR